VLGRVLDVSGCLVVRCARIGCRMWFHRRYSRGRLVIRLSVFLHPRGQMGNVLQQLLVGTTSKGLRGAVEQLTTVLHSLGQRTVVEVLKQALQRLYGTGIVSSNQVAVVEDSRGPQDVNKNGGIPSCGINCG